MITETPNFNFEPTVCCAGKPDYKEYSDIRLLLDQCEVWRNRGDRELEAAMINILSYSLTWYLSELAKINSVEPNVEQPLETPAHLGYQSRPENTKR